MAISSKLLSTLARMREAARNALELQLVAELEFDLNERASVEACVRCEHAAHILAINETKNPAATAFVPVQVHCSLYHSLPQHPDSVFGFIRPSHEFFCTSESSVQNGLGAGAQADRDRAKVLHGVVDVESTVKSERAQQAIDRG